MTQIPPGRYVKKPLPVEAMRVDGTGPNARAIRTWQRQVLDTLEEETRKVVPAEWFFIKAEARPPYLPGDGDAAVYDYLHKTWIPLWIGDWVLRGPDGEFYPHNGKAFDRNYARAVDDLEPTALQHRFLTALRTLALATFEGRGRGSGTSTALRMGAALLNNLAEIDLGSQDPPENLAPGLAETYRGTLLGDAEWTDTEEQP